MPVEDLLKYMHNFFISIDEEISLLSQELSNVDLEQQDILHYIENKNLNAGGYAKIGKLLKDIRIRRRQIKKDYEKLQTIRDILTRKYNDKFIVTDINKTLNAIELLQNKTYSNKTEILNNLEAKDE